MAYLKLIPPERWVKYVQRPGFIFSTLVGRVITFGEIGQGKYLDFMRNSHPLDFISELQLKTYSIINNTAEKHGTWLLQDVQNETNYLVPHGVKLFLDRSEQASKCTVTRMGNGGIVKISGGTEKDDNYPVLLPPAQRTKETHEKNKWKRKESSKNASKTRGRTQTSSYACASASAPMPEPSCS